MPVPTHRFAVAFLFAIATTSACKAGSYQSTAPKPEVTVLKALEEKPTVALVTSVADLFRNAGRLVLKHRPVEDMGRALFDGEQVDENWNYLVEFRCAYECDGRATELREFFASGLRTNGVCPAPIDLVVVFHDRATEATTRIFANSFANCFTFEKRSYIVTNREPKFLAQYLERSIVKMF